MKMKELRHYIWYWLTMVIYVVTVIAKDLELPGTCQLGHYYEPSTLSCLTCPANASMVTAVDALRIHLSDNTRALLDQWGTFVVDRRGEVELKGRGRMLTHWLLHCSEPEARPPSQGIQPPPQYPILFPALPQPALSLQVPYLVVEPPTLAA